MHFEVIAITLHDDLGEGAGVEVELAQATLHTYDLRRLQ